MANTTPNYNLIKPLGTEKYDVAVPNANMDNIDLQLKNLEDTKVDVEVGKGLSEENYTLIEKNKVANLPADTAAQLADIEQEVADKVQKLKATNLVVNGDFSQGTTGWIGSGATIEEEGGRLAIIASSQYGGARQSIPVLIDHKYYVGAMLESLGNDVYLVVVGEGTSTIKKTTSGVLILSGVFTASSTGSKQFGINDGRSSGWVKLYADKVKVIDLTATFGAGNEPTKEEMDELMKVIPNQWWDGELSLEQKEVVQWMLKLEREKANKAQETPIVPTLLGNWTGVAGQGPTYYKDSTGRVHLSGTVTGGALSTVIHNMPNGYKSTQPLSFVVIAGSGYGRVNVAPSGAVVFEGGTPSIVYLDGISYRGV